MQNASLTQKIFPILHYALGKNVSLLHFSRVFLAFFSLFSRVFLAFFSEFVLTNCTKTQPKRIV